MRLQDINPHKLTLQGNCINSFDEDGECIIGTLPFSTVSDLGYADENAEDVSKEIFFHKCNVPRSLAQIRRARYMEHNGLYILYDEDKDIHYFFA